MNLTCKKVLIANALALGALWATGVQAIQDGGLAPPEVKTVDRFGVDLATGQVVASLETVSIGGELGLSHRISNYTNNFDNKGWIGYADKFSGTARYQEVFVKSSNGSYFNYEGQDYAIFKVMRVHGPLGSEDFKVMVNGSFVNAGSAGASQVTDAEGYTYEALGDVRNTLVVSNNGNYLIWSMPDGTELHYWRRNGEERHAATTGYLRKIIHPNGFTINIESLAGVTTNTGFQLKYEYPVDHRGLTQEKRDIRAGYASTAYIGSVSPEDWSGRNPTYVRGINNAVEYCSPTQTESCDLTHDWPAAHFLWPGGMPQAIYLGSSIFKVTDANGGVTEYHFEAQDLSLSDVDDPNSYSPGSPWDQGERWSPRLVGIKTAESNAVNYTYTYQNRGHGQSESMLGLGVFVFWKIDSAAGEIKAASSPEGRAVYGEQSHYDNIQRIGRWAERGRTVSVETDHTYPGTLDWAIVREKGKFVYETGFRNSVAARQPLAGPIEGYYYDPSRRGNLTKITMGDVTIEAEYPELCTSQNRKYCNKPTWVKDAEGNVTRYTYHAPSGQVRTIQKPADQTGVHPQTHYEYQKLYAYYKRGNGIEQADTGIWMKTKKTECRTSSQSSNGYCSGGAADTVVTRYQYGPTDGSEANNLLLRGVSVTAQATSGLTTRTTCYQYDIYGHRIGETKPKAGITTCP